MWRRRCAGFVHYISLPPLLLCVGARRARLGAAVYGACEPAASIALQQPHHRSRETKEQKDHTLTTCPASPRGWWNFLHKSQKFQWKTDFVAAKKEEFEQRKNNPETRGGAGGGGDGGAGGAGGGAAEPPRERPKGVVVEITLGAPTRLPTLFCCAVCCAAPCCGYLLLSTVCAQHQKNTKIKHTCMRS